MKNGEDSEKLIISKDGKNIECDFLFSFTCDDNGRDYIGYTDHSMNEKGEETIYVSKLAIKDGKEELEDLTEDWEFDMINQFIESLKDGE